MFHRMRIGRWKATLFIGLWRCMGAAVAIALLCVRPSGGHAADEAALWDALRSGTHVALLRHAIAPGTGDPDNFKLGDCSTQRNLSEEGRAQAARIGVRFRANGIETARVFSSQWCRCLETARLLELGEVQEMPLLNSFFANSDQRNPQTESLKAWLVDQELKAPLVLVTHQVNITALTGIYPNSGEMVVIGRSPTGEIEVAGTIAAD
jgi:phosphohistidine phosphatase SixA